MYNYYIEEKRKKDELAKNKEITIKKILDKSSKEQLDKRYHKYESRVKNFNYDINLINHKVNDNVEAAKDVLRKRMMRAHNLNAENADRRLNAGVFSKNNEIQLRQSYLNNELNKYISVQNKKTYNKSLEYIFSSGIYLNTDNNKKIKQQNMDKEDKKFDKFCRINHKTEIIDKNMFKNPIKRNENQMYYNGEDFKSKYQLLKVEQNDIANLINSINNLNLLGSNAENPSTNEVLKKEDNGNIKRKMIKKESIFIPVNSNSGINRLGSEIISNFPDLSGDEDKNSIYKISKVKI